MNSFVMHAAPREMESTSSTMKWPDGDASQKIEELDFRSMFNEMRERSEMHSDPNTPEMSTVSQLANDAAVRTRCARSDSVDLS